ncbi:MAG: RMD1 family protein [Xanthobacteraceae bacterium]|nr:RMD1 family protein [Xanthobacteraceae bacterium]
MLRGSETDALPANLPVFGPKATVRAILVGDRIDTSGLERSDTLSTTPLTFRAGGNGIAVVFRYGVVVMIGLSALEEDGVLASLKHRIVGAFDMREEEAAQVEVNPEREDQIPPGGPIYMRAVTLERLLLVAYALADSVVLAHDERDVAAVLEQTEPFARTLATKGRTPGGRRTILKHIGNALLVQHRVSGRVAVAEDPDVLWDRPDLSRLYARLKEEYELAERVDGLNRKLKVVADTAQALTDMIDTERSLRLEMLIVALIAFEIGITFFQMWMGIH